MAETHQLRNHPWPGNVMELQNTLARAMVWSDVEVIDDKEIRQALLPLPARIRKKILSWKNPLVTVLTSKK